tara:strand:- start:742 stop:1212 length:471 start_codon:yes stop_codon:yes gene_type:complete
VPKQYNIYTQIYPIQAIDDSLRINMDALYDAIYNTLKHNQTPENYSVTLILSNDSYLKTLNQNYVGIDTSTDVLSFQSNEKFYLGDVILSVEYALRTANIRSHTLIEELQILTVHGILHLLGYTHESNDDGEQMWKIQKHILSILKNHTEYSYKQI